MKPHNYFLLLTALITILTGCNNSELKKDLGTDKILTYVPDTANQYIYNFMRIVIQDQRLDYGNGLVLIPESNISNNCSDESFLTNLLIDNKEVEPDIKNDGDLKNDSTFSTKDSIRADSTIKLKIKDYKWEISFSGSVFPVSPKYLVKGDIKYMLSEKERLKDFQWDNLRLGFNLSNKNNWYIFSIPYFSTDRKTAIITIRDLCKPFLCGSGKTVLFRFEEGKWNSYIIESWIH